MSVAHSEHCLGVDRISSSEEEVSSVSSEEETPPCSPPPEDSRCEYRIDRQQHNDTKTGLKWGWGRWEGGERESCVWLEWNEAAWLMWKGIYFVPFQ